MHTAIKADVFIVVSRHVFLPEYEPVRLLASTDELAVRRGFLQTVTGQRSRQEGQLHDE